ncbi:MAG: hypothetical protein ACFCU1_10895 [Sumerlaeia bacterium]
MLNKTIAVGHGSWITAHVKEAGGGEALTSPVYLVRKGFRHWDRDHLEEHLEKRFNALNAIEAELRELEEQVAENRVATDNFYIMRAVETAPQLRLRVANARKIYQQLLLVVAEERKKIASAKANQK